MKSSQPIILAIDTSCDDTSIAVLQGRTILSNIISSQDSLHREFGGVVPMLAKRQHQIMFPKVLSRALAQAKKTPDQIDLMAVTIGPGLAPALETGIELAQQTAQEWKVPLCGVNHLEGHLWSALAQRQTGTDGWQPTTQDFPLLGLVVSGGHTEMYWVTEFGQYQHLGGTVDDAFGEGFDKAARLLGLGYPGGAALAKLAQQGNPKAFTLPRAMRQSGDWNVSYSGLKTAMVRTVTEIKSKRLLEKSEIIDLAASFQQAAVETLTFKVEKILANCRPKAILLGGGGAANQLLRRTLRQLGKKYHAPLQTPFTSKLFRDNAAMIGLVASLRLEKNILQEASLDRRPRWPLESLSPTAADLADAA